MWFTDENTEAKLSAIRFRSSIPIEPESERFHLYLRAMSWFLSLRYVLISANVGLGQGSGGSVDLPPDHGLETLDGAAHDHTLRFGEPVDEEVGCQFDSGHGCEGDELFHRVGPDIGVDCRLGAQ